MLDFHPGFLLLIGEDGADLETPRLFVLVLVVAVLFLLVVVASRAVPLELVMPVVGGAEPEAHRLDAGRLRPPFAFHENLVLHEIDPWQEAFFGLFAGNAIQALEARVGNADDAFVPDV